MTDFVEDVESSAASESKSASDFTCTPEELVDWVEGLVALLESVDRSQGMSWCSQWWKHLEAIERFRALFEKWLEAQKEGGMSSWWIDHFDRHATVLFAKRGPFGECGTKHVERTTRRILATEQPPHGWSW